MKQDSRKRTTPNFPSILKAWRSKPWQMLGIGYYFAWTMLAVYNVGSLALTSSPLHPMLLVRISLSASLVVGLALIVTAPKKLDVLNAGKWVLSLSAGLSALGTALLSLSLSYLASFFMVVVATILIGLGNAILLLAWGEFFQCLPFPRLAGHVLLSCLFAAIISAIAFLLPSLPKFALTIALPIASATTLIFSLNENRTRYEHMGLWQNGLPKILFSCFIATVILGSVRSFPTFNEVLSEHTELIFAVMIFIFLAGIIMLVFSGRKTPIVFLYRFCMPLMVIGYGLFLIENSTIRTIAVALILGGRTLFEGLILLVYPFVSVRTKISRLYLFGLSLITLHMGTFAGLLLGNWISMSDAVSFMNLEVFCLLAVISLMIMFFFLFRELDILCITRDVNLKNSTNHKEEKGRIPSIAQMYHLSARETQVLTLLANGRTLPYIESELYISHSTARTHVKHIYEKMGVDNRQQLLDLIESSTYASSNH